MAEQALLFHAFLIYEGITKKQQTEDSFIKILEGKEILRKNNEISLIWCVIRRGALTNRAYLDQAIAFIDSTSWDVPRSKDKEVDCLPNPSNNSCLV